jgi:hypothetical protein
VQTGNLRQFGFELERLSARETGLDLVPPFDALAFTELPAEQDDPPVAHARKINKTAGVIL